MAATVDIDISADKSDICVLPADGAEPAPRWTVPNSPEGAGALIGRLASLAAERQVGELQVGMEATSLYCWHLACTLKDAPALAPYRHRVYVLNPKLTHDFRHNYGALSKTDRADAFVIAERVRFGRHLPPPFAVDLRYAPLQRLSRFRVHLTQTLAREKGYFLTFLFLKFSAFCQDPPFHDPFGATSCAVLEDFTTEELARASLEELARYLQTRATAASRTPASALRPSSARPATPNGSTRCSPIP
jgi:transposase